MNLKISVEIDGEDMGYYELNVDLKEFNGYTLDYASKNVCRYVGDKLPEKIYGVVRKALEERGIR